MKHVTTSIFVYLVLVTCTSELLHDTYSFYKHIACTHLPSQSTNSFWKISTPKKCHVRSTSSKVDLHPLLNAAGISSFMVTGQVTRRSPLGPTISTCTVSIPSSRSMDPVESGHGPLSPRSQTSGLGMEFLLRMTWLHIFKMAVWWVMPKAGCKLHLLGEGMLCKGAFPHGTLNYQYPSS